MSIVANKFTTSSVVNQVDLSGNLSVSGNLDASNLNLSNNAFITGNTDISGDLTAKNLYVDKNVYIDNDILIDGYINGPMNGATGYSLQTQISLSDGINIVSSKTEGNTTTTTTLFQNTFGGSLSNPSTFLIQDILGNKILESLTSTGLLLNNLATTTEVLSEQQIFYSYNEAKPILQIDYPFTSLLNVTRPPFDILNFPYPESTNINFTLSLTNLPLSEYPFSTQLGSNGQSITVVLNINFRGFAQNFTLNFTEGGIVFPVIILPTQIFTSYPDTTSLYPGITNSNQRLLQTVSIFYVPITNSEYTNPLLNPASYTLFIDFSICNSDLNMFQI